MEKRRGTDARTGSFLPRVERMVSGLPLVGELSGRIGHRRFSSWASRNMTGFKLVRRMPNRRSWSVEDPEGSPAELFICQKQRSRRGPASS